MTSGMVRRAGAGLQSRRWRARTEFTTIQRARSLSRHGTETAEETLAGLFCRDVWKMK